MSFQADPNLMSAERREAKLRANARRECNKGIVNGPAQRALMDFTNSFAVTPPIKFKTDEERRQEVVTKIAKHVEQYESAEAAGRVDGRK